VHVRVRMIPVGPRTVLDGEVVLVRAAGADGEPRVAVHRLRRGEPVPVQDEVLGELVAERDPHALPPPYLQSRRGEHPVEQPGCSLESASDLGGARSGGDLEGVDRGYVGNSKREPTVEAIPGRLGE
jgi:hypothetical protein